MSLDRILQKKHKELCEQENQKLIETYMCCDYYVQHQVDKNFNKYLVKNWYLSVRKKELDGVNSALEIIPKQYNAEFPIRTYEDGIFNCYPILLKAFDITDEVMAQDFIASVAFIPEFPFDYLNLMWCDKEGDIFPKGLRFTKQYLEAIHQVLILGDQMSMGSLSTPFPIDVTLKMITCFDSDTKLQPQKNVDSYVSYIGEIAQELWVYSKNCELLSADEDNVYLSHILTGIRERICSMLYEVEKHLPSEIYHDLNVLCDMIYKGEVFDDVELNALILKYQYMENE